MYLPVIIFSSTCSPVCVLISPEKADSKHCSNNFSLNLKKTQFLQTGSRSTIVYYYSLSSKARSKQVRNSSNSPFSPKFPSSLLTVCQIWLDGRSREILNPVPRINPSRVFGSSAKYNGTDCAIYVNLPSPVYKHAVESLHKTLRSNSSSCFCSAVRNKSSKLLPSAPFPLSSLLCT